MDLDKTIKGTHRFAKGQLAPIAKPTPAPWKVDASGVYVEGPIAHAPGVTAWGRVALACGINGEKEANARLIASAPNLFDACRLLLMAYADGEARGGSVDWDDVDRAHEAAQKAIAKASFGR